MVVYNTPQAGVVHSILDTLHLHSYSPCWHLKGFLSAAGRFDPPFANKHQK